jgi:hypothetical protein
MPLNILFLLIKISLLLISPFHNSSQDQIFLSTMFQISIRIRLLHLSYIRISVYINKWKILSVREM